MDWNEISNQLANGQKLYEVFKEGADLAARLASFERYNAELQTKADAFPAQLAQLAQDLQAAKSKVTQTLADGARAAADQNASLQAAQIQRVASAQKEMEAWEAKILAKSQSFDAEYVHHQDVIKGLKSQIDQMTKQIDALQQIKSNLKSQLQSQLQGVV